MSSSLLQVFVKLGNFHGTSNYVLYWNHEVACSDFVCHNRVQVLSIPVLLLAFSEDWTCNLQMIVSLEALGTNAYNCWTIQSEFLGLINLMFLLDLNYYYYVWFFTCAHIQFFFSSSLLNYRFAYCIHLYTWSTQHAIVAQPYVLIL